MLAYDSQSGLGARAGFGPKINRQPPWEGDKQVRVAQWVRRGGLGGQTRETERTDYFLSKSVGVCTLFSWWARDSSGF